MVVLGVDITYFVTLGYEMSVKVMKMTLILRIFWLF